MSFFKRSIVFLWFLSVVGATISCSITQKNSKKEKGASSIDNLSGRVLEKTDTLRKGDVLTIGETSINLDQIPRGKKLRTSNLNEIDNDEIVHTPAQKIATRSGESVQIVEQYIFTSEEKSSVGIATRFELEEEQGVLNRTVFELFDETGENIWETEEYNRMPASCILPEAGGIIGINWALSYEDESMFKFKFYDFSNNKTDSIFNVGSFKSSFNNEQFYYIKDYTYTGDVKDKNRLYYQNFGSGKKWVREFKGDLRAVLPAITKDGDNVICLADMIYSINSKGEIMWEKERGRFPGTFFLSDDGRFLLNIKATNSFFVYDNISGNEIIHKGKILIDGIEFYYDDGCFVSGGNNILAFASPIRPKTNMIVFFDIEGNLLDRIIIPNSTCNNLLIETSDQKIFEIFFDGIKVKEYSKKF